MNQHVVEDRTLNDKARDVGRGLRLRVRLVAAMSSWRSTIETTFASATCSATPRRRCGSFSWPPVLSEC